MKRVKENEIVVQVSDKCKRLCVSSMKVYEEQVNEHLKDCKKVDNKQVEEVNVTLNGTAKAAANIFMVGHDGTDDGAQRCWSNYMSESCTVPVMRLCPKLHKTINKDGTPKMRPIVGAGSCIAARASEVVADAIEAFTEGEDTIECDSTTDMLAKMTEAENRMKENGDEDEMVVGSADAVALFPSVKKKIGMRSSNRHKKCAFI